MAYSRSVFRSQSGLSLVEILIALGLVGALSLLVAGLSAQTANSAAQAKEATALATLQSHLQMVLQRPQSCIAALQKLDCTSGNQSKCTRAVVTLPFGAGQKEFSGSINRIISPHTVTHELPNGSELVAVGSLVKRYLTKEMKVTTLVEGTLLTSGSYSGKLKTPVLLQVLLSFQRSGLANGFAPAVASQTLEVPLQVVTDPVSSQLLSCSSQTTIDPFTVSSIEGTPDLQMQCSNLWYLNSNGIGNWVAAGCAQIPFTTVGSGYAQGEILSPPACPEGFVDDGVSVSRSGSSAAAGMVYSRNCRNTDRTASILKLACSNLWFWNPQKNSGSWVASGCKQSAFSLVEDPSKAGVYYQGATLEPASCPSGFKDLGVSVRAATGSSAAGFVYERMCEKKPWNVSVTRRSCTTLWYTSNNGAYGNWVTTGCESVPFKGLDELKGLDLHPYYYEGPALSPQACAQDETDLGVTVEPEVEGNGSGFTHSRVCMK